MEQLAAPAENRREGKVTLQHYRNPPVMYNRNTYSKYTSYNPSMVLPKSLSISII